MENFDQATAATGTALNSQGSAMRENEKYLESYEAKINMVKNAWTETTIALKEDFMGDLFVGFTSSATGAIKVITSVVEKVGMMPVIFGTTGLAITLFSKNLRQAAMVDGRLFSGWLKQATTGVQVHTVAQKRMTAAQLAGSVATRGITSAINGLRGGLTFLAGAIAPLAAMMAASWGITTLIKSIKDAREATEAFAKEMDTSVESIATNKEEISELIEEYDKLSKVGEINRNIDQEERYTELQNQLAQYLPVVAQGEDEKGNAIITNAENLEKYVEMLDAQLAFEQKLARQSAESDIDSGQKKLERAEEKIARLENSIANRQELQLVYARGGEKEDAILFEETGASIKRLQETLKEVQATHNEAVGDIRRGVTAIAQDYSELANENDLTWLTRIAQEAEVSGDQMEGYMESLVEKTVELRKVVGEDFELGHLNLEQFEILSRFPDEVVKNKETLIKYSEEFERTGMVMEEINPILGMLRYSNEELAASAVLNNTTMEESVPIFSDYASNIEWVTKSKFYDTEATEDNTIAQQENTGTKWDAVSVTEVLIGVTADQVKQAEQAIDIIGLLTGTENLNERQKDLLASATQHLASIFPHLDGAIEDNIDVIVKEINMMAGLNSASGGSAKLMVDNQNSVTKATIEQSRQRIRALQQEREALQKMFEFHKAMAPKRKGEWIPTYTPGMRYASDALMRGNFESRIASAQASIINVAYASGVETGHIKAPARSTPRKSSSSKRPSSSSSKRPSSAEASRRETEAAREAEEAQRRVLDNINKQIDAYLRKGDVLDYDIRVQQFHADQLESTSPIYRKRIENIIELTRQQRTHSNEAIWYANHNLQNNKRLNKEQKQELEDRVRSLKDNHISIREEISKLTESIIDSKMDEYAQQISNIEHSLALSEKTMLKYTSTSKGYRDSLREQSLLLDDKRQLLHEEAEYIRRQIRSDELSARSKARLRGELEKLGLAWWDVTESIKDYNAEIVKSKSDEYSDLIDGVERSLKKLELQKQFYDEDSFVYLDVLAEEIRHLEYKQRLYREQQEFLRKELELRDLSVEQIKSIKKEISDIELTIWDLEGAINSVKNSTKDSSKKLADNMVDAMKSVYEERKQAAIRANDELIRIENERHKNVMDNYSEELSEFEKLINAKLKGIDDEYDEDTHNKELAKMRKEQLEIQNQIDLLQLDDSQEAKAKRHDLEKELAEQVERIDNFQADRRRQQRKDSLNEQLKDFQEEVKKKEKAENKKHKAEIDRIEQIKKEETYKYDELIRNERKWSAVREDIIRGEISRHKGFLDEFVREFESMNDQTLNNLKESFKEVGVSYQELLNLIDKVKESSESAGKPPTSTTPDTSGAPNASNNSEKVIKHMQANSEKWKRASAGERIVLERENRILGRSLGATLNEKTGAWEKDGMHLYHTPRVQKIVDQMQKNSAAWFDADPQEKRRLSDENKRLGRQIGAHRNVETNTWMKDGLKLYHKGGIIGGKTNRLTELANNLFNAKPNEQVVKSLKGELQIPPQNIPNIFENIRGLVGSTSSDKQAGDTFIFDFNIDRLDGGEADVQKFSRKIMTNIRRRKGGNFS